MKWLIQWAVMGKGNYKVMNKHNCQYSRSITFSKSIQQLRLRERMIPYPLVAVKEQAVTLATLRTGIGKQLRGRKSGFSNWISAVKHAEQHMQSRAQRETGREPTLWSWKPAVIRLEYPDIQINIASMGNERLAFSIWLVFLYIY